MATDSNPQQQQEIDMPREQIPYLVIEPVAGWRSLKLNEVWEFRDLLWALGMRDVKLVYKQTLLGVAWVVLQPLVGAGIFAFVFGLIADMPAGSLPYFVFAYAGMLGWTLFSSTLTGASMVMIGNAHLVSKIYFPRLLLPLSSCLQPIVNFGVGFVLMAVLLVVYRVPPSIGILGLPLAVLSMLALALGGGFWCSSVMVRYRDLRFVVPVAVQFLLYASPVGYSLSAISERVPVRYQFFYMLNPLSTLIELFRYSLLGDGLVSGAWLMYSVAFSFLALILGAYSFRRSERAFADVI